MGWEQHVVQKRSELLDWCDHNIEHDRVTAGEVHRHFNRPGPHCWINDRAYCPYSDDVGRFRWFRRTLNDERGCITHV